MSQTERVLFVLLMLAYLVVGALFAIRTPAWQAPDEPAHYNYVAQVTTNGCCPILEPGDWNSAYLDNLKGVRFRPDTIGDLGTIQYEDHQPPLYYLLESIIFRLTNGSLTALRLFSLLLGAGVVAGTYAVGKAILPHAPQIALGAATFVAFLPQHIAMLASVENDALAELVVAVTLWATIVYLKSGTHGRIKAWHLGVLVGIGLLTKVSTIFLAGLVPLAILIKWWITRDPNAPVNRPVQTALGLAYVKREGTVMPFEPIRRLIAFGLPALILACIWWLRDISVYGFPDVFGLGRHNQVVVGQLRTADYIAQLGVGEYLRSGLETTFNSFWGQFGWMALPLPPLIYTAILLVLALTAVGWLIGRLRPLVPETDRPAQRAAWFILGLTALLAVLQYFYYNTEFVQFQGRYMYPGLIPLGIWIVLGLDGWRRLIFAGDGKQFTTLRPYLGVTVIALLIPLDLYVVWRVLPGLAP